MNFYGKIFTIKFFHRGRNSGQEKNWLLEVGVQNPEKKKYHENVDPWILKKF